MATEDTGLPLPWVSNEYWLSEEWLSLEDVGLEEGDRIEVKWEVTDDDGEAATTWWGAKVLGASAGTSIQASNKVLAYDIRYDAYGEFEEQTAQVGFTSMHTCENLEGSQEELYWRKEGSDWDETWSEIVLNATDSPKTDEASKEILESIPDAATRDYVEKGMKQWVTDFRQYLTAKLEHKGTNVVEEADVREFSAMMNTKRRRRK